MRKVLKYITENKRIMYLICISMLLILTLLLNTTFSLFTESYNKETANVKVGKLNYNMVINEVTLNNTVGQESNTNKIIGDRILLSTANNKESFEIVLKSLNKYPTKYEITYKVCSNINCTSFITTNDIKIYYNSETPSAITGEIGSNETKTIQIVTENNSNTNRYILINLNVGYAHNELILSNQITESFTIKSNSALDIITYVDGELVKEGPEFPSSAAYIASLVCINAEGSQINDPGQIYWSASKWIVALDNIPLDSECSAYFVENSNIYGVRRNIDSSSSAWERTDASVGLVANAQIGETAVQNDFDNIYPWSAIDTYSLNLTTGEEISLKEVGVEIFPFDGSHGEILTRIPEFYYQRTQVSEDGKTYEYIRISSVALEGFTKSEAFSVGRYTMSGNSTAVHSKSGVYPLASTTITNFRNYARKLGSDFGQLDYRYFILQLLYLVEYADYNSQAKLGLGYTNSSNAAAITSGGCDTLGMKSGSRDGTDNTSIIYRGIEDIYGNVWQFIDGINIKDYVTYICYDPSQYTVDTFTGCYNPVGYTNLNITEGYPSKLGYDVDNPLVAMPIVSGGSSSTYITDYYYSASGNRIALVGGAYWDGVDAGLWCWDVDYASSKAIARIGARLLRYN